MPFKKKIYHHTDGAGVSFDNLVLDEVNQIVDDKRISKFVVKKVDMSDIANCPSFPDIDTFNDLDSQLRAGVPLKRVNTNVLHQDDVAEVNSLCESVIDNVELVKSNENEN